ncbi:exopolysaccharide Pel transporter PelG [Bradyrhizobium sp. HKCCYLS20291]|uniref:exopolysaccharide Pel transporter PelG n=1 Tax=Bradyrhizobium sp. HKCCYLS20291 TaxID=3420766 RepID=UPI003EBB4CCC
MINSNATISDLTRRGTLAAIFGAYSYAAMIVAGPWLFTVLGLSFLSATACDGTCLDLTIFRSVVIYNSMFSLIITSPLAFFAGRYTSRQIYRGSEDHVYYVLVLSLAIFLAVVLLLVVSFYVFGTTLEAIESLASIHTLFLIGCAWLLIPFLGAIRAHNQIIFAFGAGSLAILLFSHIPVDTTVTSLLLSFNGGFTIIDLIMMCVIVRRFGCAIVVDRDLIGELREVWELPLAGFAYALGLWIDKIVMWHLAPSDSLAVAGLFQTMPSYDTAMFWSQLSSIPVIAIFVVHVETRFSARLSAFHRAMQARASLTDLKDLVSDATSLVLSSIVALFGTFTIVAAMMILASVAFMPQLGLRPAYMSILRISLCAMAFYSSAILCFNFLLLMDLRRPALRIVFTFLVLNGALTLAFLPLGPAFYGYGSLFASAASLLVGFRLLMKELPWIHFHAFITNNSSL